MGGGEFGIELETLSFAGIHFLKYRAPFLLKTKDRKMSNLHIFLSLLANFWFSVGLRYHCYLSSETEIPQKNGISIFYG